MLEALSAVKARVLIVTGFAASIRHQIARLHLIHPRRTHLARCLEPYGVALSLHVHGVKPPPLTLPLLACSDEPSVHAPPACGKATYRV